MFKEHSYLAEVKGIRNLKDSSFDCQRIWEKIKEFQSDFILSLVTNLDDIPKLVLIDNPLNHFSLKEYHKTEP